MKDQPLTDRDTQAEPLRVLIVDDSALYRQAISAALDDMAGVRIVGIAKDGRQAIDEIVRLSPDVITLDVEMPNMNGIETLREIHRRKLDVGAIMVSSLTEAGAKVTLQALFEGAFDFIAKPTGGITRSRDVLRAALAEKLDAFRTSRIDSSASASGQESSRAPIARPHDIDLGNSPADSPGCDAVLIGSSTGGPQALRHVLPRFDDGFPTPIILVQHMPANYTDMMAKRISEECSLPLAETHDGDVIRAGRIHVAPGGRHLSFVPRGSAIVARLTDDPSVNSCRPSVDYTLGSAIDIYGGSLLAVIMTGMGKDGLAGCERLKSLGGSVYAQDAATSAVYGMPKAVIEAGLADRVLPLAKISAAITRHVHRRGNVRIS